MMDEICKVAIIDDDLMAIDELYRSLDIYTDLKVKGTASCGVKGQRLILELRPDLLFLDIELPDMLGFKLLDGICDEVVWDMKVVFYTAYDQYMLEALHNSAFDYLLKPFLADELEAIIVRYRKALTLHQKTPSFSSAVSTLMPVKNTFMISTVTGFRLLRLEEIGFFEYVKDKRQWQVILFDQTKLSLKRHTKAEDIICYSDSFVQVSQSIIINVNYLAVINDKQCQLCPPFHGFEELIISRGFLKDLHDRFYLI